MRYFCKKKTIQFSEYEIIVVDNREIEPTPLTFSCKHIINSKNLYPFESRRIGLDNASGDYVWFIDCDDFTINKLYADDLKDGADIFQMDFEVEVKPGFIPARVISWNKDRLIGNFHYGLWSRIFRTSFLKNLLSPIRRPLYLIHKDDNFIMDFALSKTSNISFIKKQIYHYNQYLAGNWVSPLSENENIRYLYSFVNA